jgi:hypothetical protein
MAWRDWRWRAACASCGQPLVPTGPQSLIRIFSNHGVLAGAPLRNRTVDLLLTMEGLPGTSRLQRALMPGKGSSTAGLARDLAMPGWSVNSRGLFQPRTEADWETRHGEQPESLRSRAKRLSFCTWNPYLRPWFVGGAQNGIPVALAYSGECVARFSNMELWGPVTVSMTAVCGDRSLIRGN